MTDSGATTELHFEPPGPGSWGRDAVHFPRPATRYWAEMHPAALKRGTSEFARYYGMLIDGLQMEYVNGIAYSRVGPAPEEEIPQRFQRAEEVFAGKLWREQLREWDETVKPSSIATHREIQAVDPDALSDEELGSYITRCRDHHAAMITQHMRFTAAAMIPTGDFLAHVGDWTGLPPAELLGLMRGAAPVSAGGSEELERLTNAIGKDADAVELLGSQDDPGRILAALRALPGEAGSAVSGYLDLVGCRPLDGFDISEPSALELPDALVRSIRVAVSGRDMDASGVDDLIAGVRSKVPEEHRAEFDELLGEARLIYRLRDERGIYSDIWASGLMRRAVLAGGRRLASRGRIHDAEHLVDAGVDEMRSLLSDSGGPSADELAARSERRASYTARARRDPRASPAAAAGPLRPAARRRATDARDGHRVGLALRELRGRARGASPARAGGEPGHLRRAGPARLRSLRVRPDRPRRRAADRVDHGGVQHLVAAARRDRHRQRRLAVALRDRRA